VFRSFSRTELDFVTRFKSGEMKVEGGATVLMSGTRSPHLFTVLSGWGYREKTLEDGRRSILNFVLPGDLVGLQSALFCEMNHSVEALTDMTLCVFQRSDIEALFRREPGLAFTVVWHAARAERILDEHLLSVGRRSAAERIAYLMVFLLERARGLDLVEPGSVRSLISCVAPRNGATYRQPRIGHFLELHLALLIPCIQIIIRINVSLIGDRMRHVRHVLMTRMVAICRAARIQNDDCCRYDQYIF